ncbi:MAG: chemotaxis protein CheA [Alteromonas macleodii]|mgnify:FL=1|jgi:two-component system chemotaxis sensor kinase CheA|uniref:chemotaxis protein CheA n=1 Tax=Alteromonas TaxID=226 RepID=UPI00127338E7|nr:chemotaxis protein CheW [Alteromonas macleodii]MDM7963710.1 chemotaxis protein CheW [Alteromonas macleodii]MDM8172172.1 chemotaxis protein CheW [Alteromonas macleodii]CAI3928025.1 two-component system chemotaxis sensor kinase CheA [Alteromonas macleodii]VTP51852.1 two-component system chemotaxis sensor kinase CheA [Alteromonas macleodii]|tara:strand:- start:1292 stop:3385 length:2094 start_codon:yes stop_codon:yes gene_type:complete
MSIDIEQFHGVFFDESDEHLDDMEQLLMSLDVESPDPEELNSIFRAAHSIKGGSGIFGFDALMNLTHVMENLLDKARNNELSVTADIVNVLLETLDVLKDTLNAYRDETPVPEDSIAERIKILNGVINGQSTDAASGDGDDASEVSVNAQNESAQDDSFGFFDDEPNSAIEAADDSFGFFDDEPVNEALSHGDNTKSENNDDDGFGFFDDEISNNTVGAQTATTKAETAEVEQGFGFFEDAPSATNINTSLEIASSNNAQSASTQLNTATTSNNDKAPTSGVAPTTTQAKTPPKPPAKKSTARESASIRVDTTKIDAMVNLVGELVITQSMLSMIGQDVEGQVGERLQLAIDELQRNTREIQESVMSMRMLPLTATFNRFPRLVRDLAGKLGKQVELVLQGGSTEIDKSLIEKIVDPLTHLVRNSIDHGIEMPDKRVAAGKPEKGTVILSAEQKGGSIIISIIDDGGGLHRDKILDKARSNGLTVSDDMPDSEVWQLIFQPGFSTAEAITDVSGRGVGMDVVRRNIESIGGRIDIESSAGEGSAFFIHLPLTLAIVDGMCVSVGKQIFVIPLLNIIESFQPTKQQLKTLGNDTVLYIRDQYWPLVPLYDFMEVEDAALSPTEGIVVLLESSKKRFGVLVDALVGQQQVVIKSLEEHYRKVAGIAGATIMGDGKVALIIDADSIATTYTSSQIEELLS